MRRLVSIFVLAPAAYASLLDSDAPVTLDAGELSRIWQEVRSGAPAAPAAGAADTWQSALLAGDSELGRVLLLAWLQEQNPLLPMLAHAQEYADAVALHLGALHGQSAACAAVAQAYRVGQLGGLQLPPSEEKARWFEQRALAPENLPK
jgi:hypothetical protein